MGKFKSFFKKNGKTMLKYLGLFLVMLILTRATIVGKISPFGYSYCFALILLQVNAIFVAISHILTSIIFNLSLEGLIIYCVSASAMLLLFLLFKIIKRQVNLVSTLAFSILSQAGYVYFNISSPTQILVTIAMIVVGILFVYICNQTLGAIFYRGISSRFTLDEMVCFAIFSVAFFSGISNLYISYVNLTPAIVVFLILVVSRCFSKTSVIYLSALAGIGSAFCVGNVVSTAVFVVFGVLAVALSNHNRFFAPVLIVASDVVFGMFLNVYPYYNIFTLLPTLIVCAIYLCLPSKLFNFVRGFSYSYEGSLANEYIISGQKSETKQRLEKIGQLFKQMQVAYRNLSIGEIDRVKASEALADDVIGRHCATCPNFAFCQQNDEIKRSIQLLFAFGFEKKRVTLIDASNKLTTTCSGLGSLIEEVNQSLSSYFEFENEIKNDDGGKMLVSKHLGSTGDIINEVAVKLTSEKKLNSKFSMQILDELTINRIVASEVLVLEDEAGIWQIIMVVRNSDVTSPQIVESLRSVLKLNFALVSQKMSRLAGWSILVFEPAPKYKVQIGFSARAKNSVSGDTYSFLNLGSNKYLFALSDGMGHGARANKISSSALNLVEGFYRSGFSTQTIISSVNQLLLPRADDNFACLDACIVDIFSGTADFVKMGSSASLIKQKNTIKTIIGESLPIGMVQKVKASINKVILTDQDIIIISSDGVVDAFSSVEEYANYVNNERVINVQMLADSILEEAVARVKSAGEEPIKDDDMSVIAVKVVANFQ